MTHTIKNSATRKSNFIFLSDIKQVMAYTKNKYTLPFKRRNLIKAVSDPRAHFANFKNAIDFILPEGTKLFAPRAGNVIEVKVNSKQGGSDPKYSDIKYQNYMTLQHDDGEFSQYVHLKYKGAIVKVGDKVKTSQPIAISGNTGFSTMPHLHFQVFRLNNSKEGWETLKVRFNEKILIDRKIRPIPKSMRKPMKYLEKLKKKMK